MPTIYIHTTIAGGRFLVEYEIQMEALEMSSNNNISQAEVKIVFRRRMEFHVTNTFLQTLILLLVGYMSYYFKEDNFTDRIMVTLTTMLVIVVIASSIQDVRTSISQCWRQVLLMTSLPLFRASPRPPTTRWWIGGSSSRPTCWPSPWPSTRTWRTCAPRPRAARGRGADPSSSGPPGS